MSSSSTPPSGSTPPPFAIRSQRTASGLPSTSRPPVATPPAVQPAPAEPPQPPQRSGGSFPWLAMLGALGLLGAGAGAYLLLSSSGGSDTASKRPAPTPAATTAAEPVKQTASAPVPSASPLPTPPSSQPENATTVRALRVEAEGLLARAREGDETPERLASLSKASALLAESQGRERAGDFSGATRLLVESRQASGTAAFKTESAKLERALGSISIANARDYFEDDWKRIDDTRAQAAALLAAGEPGAALEYLRALQKAAVELRARIVARLLEHGRTAAESQDRSLALFAYAALHELEPKQQEALAYLYRNRFKPGELSAEKTSGLAYCYIPPGTFQQGSPPDEPGRDKDEAQRPVTITRGYFLSQTEVTQAQWDAVMGSGAAESLVRAAGSSIVGAPLPMHSITYAQALEFCERLSAASGIRHRLPTEAEWEFAARAGTTSAFNTGASILRPEQARIDDPAREAPGPAPAGTVGKANAWGLQDMHGNMLEWTSDWSAPYPKGAATDPTGPADSNIGRGDLAMRIVRGGSWQDDSLKARSANRMEQSPAVASETVGFRVVREVSSFALQ